MAAEFTGAKVGLEDPKTGNSVGFLLRHSWKPPARRGPAGKDEPKGAEVSGEPRVTSTPIHLTQFDLGRYMELGISLSRQH